ncbi:MAG: hypothetical protein KDD83_09070, partial [Caldilineaceae bacterium]|nr:hypothetical protein [Caldilineaceae bacterium]
MSQLLNYEDLLLDESTYAFEFRQFAAKMKAEELPELVIRSFHYYYNQLRNGATGYIGGDDTQPVRAIPDYEALDDRYAAAGEA